MPSEPLKRKLQHDFCRARWPAALTLCYFEPFQKAAYVDQQAGQFRADRVNRVMHALSSCDDGVRQKTCLMTTGSTVGRNGI